MDRDVVTMERMRTRSLSLAPLWALLIAGCGHPAPATTPSSAPADGGAAVESTTKEQALSLIEEEQFEQAAQLLAKIRPSEDPEVEVLWTVAQTEGKAKAALIEACVDTDGADIAEVYDHCWRIPRTSRYADKGCCTVAADRFGEAKLAEAVETLRAGRAAEALSIAELLVADERIPQEVRTQAERTAKRAERRLARHGQKRDEEAEQAYEEAKALIAHDDHGGCIRVLVSAPRTEKVIRVLISCYFEAGELRSACLLARQHEELSSARGFAEMRCP